MASSYGNAKSAHPCSDVSDTDIGSPRRRRRLTHENPDSVDWIPGAGVPCYCFGPPSSRRNNERLFRTTILFRELEVILFFFIAVNKLAQPRCWYLAGTSKKKC